MNSSTSVGFTQFKNRKYILEDIHYGDKFLHAQLIVYFRFRLMKFPQHFAKALSLKRIRCQITDEKIIRLLSDVN